MSDIFINDQLAIPEDELSFSASRSSGPGGQHVNKVASRITLRFDVGASPSLEPEQKERLQAELATRINKAGVLSVSSQRERSQTANRQAATERFAELLRQALAETPERRATRVPAKSRTRRLEAKRRRAKRKRDRASIEDWS